MSYKVTVATTITLDDELGDTSDSVIKYQVSRTFTSLATLKLIEHTIQNTTAVLWDTSVSGELPTTFQVLVLIANQPIDVELTTNEGDANEELSSLTLAANTALVLGADDSYYNHSASNAWGGSADVIDKVRIQEPNNTETRVRGFVIA